jgi:hypothetical protein
VWYSGPLEPVRKGDALLIAFRTGLETERAKNLEDRVMAVEAAALDEHQIRAVDDLLARLAADEVSPEDLVQLCRDELLAGILTYVIANGAQSRPPRNARVQYLDALATVCEEARQEKVEIFAFRALRECYSLYRPKVSPGMTRFVVSRLMSFAVHKTRQRNLWALQELWRLSKAPDFDPTCCVSAEQRVAVLERSREWAARLPTGREDAAAFHEKMEHDEPDVR